MTDLKRMRLVLGLRQIDCCFGTGIPIQRLSLAERGQVQLTEPQRQLLIAFLAKKWKAQKQSRQRSSSYVQDAQIVTVSA